MSPIEDYAHDTTLKLGTNRGNPRVWIEGGSLAKAGFVQGDKFRAVFGDKVIVLEKVEDGDRKVSGRSRDGKPLPIIDINAGEIAEALGTGVARIAVKIRRHRIEITPSRIAGMIAARVMTGVAVGAFVGAGLLSQAVKAAGFQTVAANEIHADYAEAHESNHGGHTLNSCISEVDWRAVRAKVGPVGLFHAGIPCEPFSAIRRNDGSNVKVNKALAKEAHELGDMTFWTLLAVDTLNPHSVIIEEVPAWLESGAGQIARHALARMGYTVDARVVDAADLGGMTSRKRAVMVATSFAAVVWPEGGQDSAKLSSVLLSAEDSRCEWFSRETESKSWLFDHWDKQTAKGNGFASAVIRYDDVKVGTIKKRYFAGQGDNPVVAHPTQPGLYRWLTIEEVKAIMGLPADYWLGSTKTLAGEMMGQGVEVTSMTAIVRSVMTEGCA